MNLVWTWWGVPGTFAFVAAWCCAIVALRTDPRRTLNQHLTLILILEGLYMAGIAGMLFFFDNPAIVTALATIGTAAMVALPFQYLSFLAVSLHTPLVAPFRSPAAKILLDLASIVPGPSNRAPGHRKAPRAGSSVPPTGPARRSLPGDSSRARPPRPDRRSAARPRPKGGPRPRPPAGDRHLRWYRQPRQRPLGGGAALQIGDVAVVGRSLRKAVLTGPPLRETSAARRESTSGCRVFGNGSAARSGGPP